MSSEQAAGRRAYVVKPKLDGLSIELVYEDACWCGRRRAAGRGDHAERQEDP